MDLLKCTIKNFKARRHESRRRKEEYKRMVGNRIAWEEEMRGREKFKGEREIMYHYWFAGLEVCQEHSRRKLVYG